MKKLDTYKEFTYTYYESCDKLKSEYNRMYKITTENGHALESNSWQLESGILLENEINYTVMDDIAISLILNKEFPIEYTNSYGLEDSILKSM